MIYDLKIVRNGLDDKGQPKKFNEHYLVDALSILEAVTMLQKELSAYYEEFEIHTAKRTSYSEAILIDGDDTRYYHAKFAIISIDEKSGKEKKTLQHIVIEAADYDEAKRTFADISRTWVCDFELTGLVETPVLDYIKG